LISPISSWPEQGLGGYAEDSMVVMPAAVPTYFFATIAQAVALVHRTERLIGRDRGANLVVVVRTLGLGRLLDFEQVGRVDLARPSARTVPLPNSMSSVGSSFILATTLVPSSVLAASTAFR
jgi:hypothetical protein